MTERRSARDFLADIVEAGERVATYVAGCDADAFSRDRLRVDATTHCVAVIGEAARRAMKLDPELRQLEDLRIDLDNAYRTRNVLTHDYYRVDEDVLWRTATRSVPTLVEKVRAILAKRETPDAAP